MKSNMTVMIETQAVYVSALSKAVEKLLYQQVKIPSEKRRSVLDGHVPRGLEVTTGCYSEYPAGGKYPALAEYLKREPNSANQAQLGRQLLTRVLAHIKHRRP